MGELIVGQFPAVRGLPREARQRRFRLRDLEATGQIRKIRNGKTHRSEAVRVRDGQEVRLIGAKIFTVRLFLK
jgi:hypothetical protein